MKIYTKTGDDGETGLFGGQRVAKSDLRVCAYGDVDEACSYVGLVRAQVAGLEDEELRRELDSMLGLIQDDLFVLGADLATPHGDAENSSRLRRLEAEQVTRLEQWIDRMDAELPAMRSFILPGGHIVAAGILYARAIVRRAERQVVTLSAAETVSRNALLYLNRLSDLLFVLGRWINHRLAVPETPWNSPD